MEKANRIAGVEEVDIIMRASQVKFVARSMADPSGVGDMCPKSVRSENEENREEGRDWRDKSIRWMPKEHKGRDGYTLTASRMIAPLGLEENEELSWGDRYLKVEIQEINLELGGTGDRKWWQTRLQDEEVTKRRRLVFSDGSMLENGRVGRGWYGKGWMGCSPQGNSHVGVMATV